jgi:hypothetical protein
VSDAIYVAAADLIDSQARHGNRVQDYAFGLPYDPIRNPEGFRAYTTLKRYKAKHHLTWETSPFGRRTYFSEKAHAILVAVRRELALGHDLHTCQIARMTGASQGYVTKVLQHLHQWRFIVVAKVIRGRWGRIVAALAERRRQSFLPSKRDVPLWRNDYVASLTEERYQRDIDPRLRALAAKPWTLEELGVA